MTRRVRFAPEAEAQLLSLYRYIAAEASPAIARRYAEAIIARCESLETFAERGTPRDDVRPGLRTMAFRRRVTIAFRVTGEEVSILGIFGAGQDVEALLRED